MARLPDLQRSLPGAPKLGKGGHLQWNNDVAVKKYAPSPPGSPPMPTAVAVAGGGAAPGVAPARGADGLPVNQAVMHEPGKPAP